MSNLRRIAIVLIILCMVGALSFAFADGQSAPQITDSPGASARANALASPTTVKATIAPIETRELSVKPPSGDGVTASPFVTVTQISSPVPSPTRTIVPTTEQTHLPASLDDSASATSFFQWGLAFLSQGEYKAAMSEFEKSLAREPQNLETWYYIGLCAEALGYMEQAYNAYVYILRVDPTFTPTKVVGGESALFLELQANLPPYEHIGETHEETLSDWRMSLLMGALLAIVAIFALSFITRQHYQKEPAAPANTVSAPRQMLSLEKINQMTDETMEYFDGERKVVVELLIIAAEIAVEGREGKHVGTAFILGDTERVLEYSRQLILNPFEGHTNESRSILTPQVHGSIKELAQTDGAFIISGDGVVVAAGRYITIDTSKVHIPAGFGTRHVSTAAITEATNAIGVVVSESGGFIRIFAKGTIITSSKT
ncbi:MAG: diadenylate cyclase [Euryarchaeota archaeon]|nr:diadenylate cyclase [Euryarchaeota archaeon]